MTTSPLWAYLAVVCVVFHILQEVFQDFFTYLNKRASGMWDWPISAREALRKDSGGLMLFLAILLSVSPYHAWAGELAIGIIAADLIQHIAFSLLDGGNTPGFTSSGLYGGLLLTYPWAASGVSYWTLLGAALLGGNLFSVYFRAARFSRIGTETEWRAE